SALGRLKPVRRGSNIVVAPNRLVPLSSLPLPSPLHLLGAVPFALRSGAQIRSPRDALAMARFFLAALLLRPEHLSPRERRRLDHTSITEFGASLGASSTLLGSELF